MNAIADLLERPEADHCEFVDGRLVEKVMGAEASAITATLFVVLGAYIREHQLGRTYDSETGYKCFPHDTTMLRKPDFSFVRKDRLPNGKSPRGHFSIVPDLAVEVISPNDLYEDVERKLNDYRLAGVPLVWVISPTSQTILVRRVDGSCAFLDVNGQLDGEQIVPGFSCSVAELFA
jgi:Uma2 family endonuclease